jgi:TRAP-type C4-dicarboxylate transport system permease small subunit
MSNEASAAPAAEPKVAHPPAPAGVRRFFDRWHTVECYVAVVAFSVIACLLLLDVLGREFLGPILRVLGLYYGPTGIFGSQRVSVYALVIGSFAGIGIATATASHLVPRVGFGWTPKSWTPWIDRAADVVTGLVLFAIAYYGFKFVASSKAVDLRAPVLNWSIWPIQLAIPLGFISAGVRYFAYAAWPALRPEPPEFQE